MNRGFPKIRGTFWGVPIIRTIVFRGPYWGPLILGNYQLPEAISSFAPSLSVVMGQGQKMAAMIIISMAGS